MSEIPAGEMARLIREFDWAATPLGPMGSWPRALAMLVDLILAHPTTAVVLWGPDLIQVYNDAYARVAGAKHPAALGRPNRESWPEVWHINAPAYERVLSRGESVLVENQLFPIDRQGALVDAYFTVTYAPARDDEGRVAGVFLTAIETTARVRSEARLRAIVDQAPLAIAFTGPSGEILYRNPMFDRLWGRPAPATAALGYGEVYQAYHPDGHPLGSEDWPGARAVLKGEVIENEVYEVVQAGGRRVACWFAAAPIRDPSGTIAGAVVTFRDVSSERRTEAALQASEQRFRSLVTASATVVYRMSPDWSEMRRLEGHGFLVDTETSDPTWLGSLISRARTGRASWRPSPRRSRRSGPSRWSTGCGGPTGRSGGRTLGRSPC